MVGQPAGLVLIRLPGMLHFTRFFSSDVRAEVKSGDLSWVLERFSKQLIYRFAEPRTSDVGPLKDTETA
ncbi:MAG: hypothetical protein ACR2N0_12425 [Rubrobacteraceae bacterium]